MVILIGGKRARGKEDSGCREWCTDRMEKFSGIVEGKNTRV
jgi:hypothetical protein